MLLQHIIRAVALLAVVPAPAVAQGAAGSSDALKQCAAMEDEAGRLRCYDALAGRPAANPTAVPPSPTVAPVGDSGRWQTRRQRSKLADTDDVFLSVTSDNQVSTRLGRDNVVLRVQCMENTTAVSMEWPTLLSTRAARIETRMDRKPVQMMWWVRSTDFKQVGLWSGRAAIPFLRQLMQADEFVARLTPRGENPETVTFTVRGLNDAIEPVRKACKW